MRTKITIIYLARYQLPRVAYFIGNSYMLPHRVILSTCASPLHLKSMFVKCRLSCVFSVIFRKKKLAVGHCFFEVTKRGVPCHVSSLLNLYLNIMGRLLSRLLEQWTVKYKERKHICVLTLFNFPFKSQSTVVRDLFCLWISQFNSTTCISQILYYGLQQFLQFLQKNINGDAKSQRPDYRYLPCL